VHFTKHYTIDEARALLPQIREWFADLDRCQARLRESESRLAALLAKHDDIGGAPANDLVRALADCKDTLQKFALRQIQIKDVDRGLIDFPSIRNGEEVFLCWEKDEADIEYWHDLQSGFAGREPL
jgi:hypothetical protein